MNMIFYDFRDSEKEYFQKHPNDDFDIKFVKSPLNDDTEISEHDAKETCIISIFMTSKITSTVLNKFKNLRVITTRSTGFDHIDIDECAKRNIRVLNIEHYGKSSVTEYTIGMIITLIRKIVPAIRDMRNENVDTQKYIGRDLNKLKLGVIGTGAIGSSVCKVAKSLGMEIIANDRQKNTELKDIADYTDFETLLKEADIITLHIPYTKDAFHLISEYELSLMKTGSYIINTARGELIDTAALYNAIESGKIAGCALDVLECENVVINNDEHLISNISKADKFCIQRAIITQKLAESDKVIITPHIAYNTIDAINTILEITFQNIRNYLKGDNSTNRVV